MCVVHRLNENRTGLLACMHVCVSMAIAAAKQTVNKKKYRRLCACTVDAAGNRGQYEQRTLLAAHPRAYTYSKFAK